MELPHSGGFITRVFGDASLSIVGVPIAGAGELVGVTRFELRNDARQLTLVTVRPLPRDCGLRLGFPTVGISRSLKHAEVTSTSVAKKREKWAI